MSRRYNPLPPDVDASVDVTASAIVDAAAKVRTAIGAGLLERPYRVCLAHELRKRGHHVSTEVALPLQYDDLVVEAAYRLDLVVDDAVVVEVKAVEELHPLHVAQLLTYLRLSRRPLGLLVNFNAIPLSTGIRRFVRPS